FAGNPGSEITVYPNPIINGVINIQMHNQVAGLYEIKIINPLGQEIISKKIVHAGGNITQTIELNNRSAKGVYQIKIIKPDGTEQVERVLN
ncbi:MAG: T9SS type A sorting domain-containing protein, partial [Bacteroidota bacterium]|nr:T9SS type A sorting domain-containing protein [Bacteroidota bacterium]